MNIKSTEEKIKHSSILIPYTYYKCAIPDFYPYVPLHWHNEFEIHMILNGFGSFKCGDSCFTAKKDDVVIIPPNTLHSITPIDNEKIIYDTIVFSSEILCGKNEDRCFIEFLKPIVTGECKVINPIDCSHCYYEEIITLTQNIMSCAKANNPKLDLLMKSEIMKLFWLIDDSKAIINTKECDLSPRSEQLRSALNYISQNYKNHITVEMLANEVHLSSSYFMACFKRITGLSVVEYINRIKIKAACDMLINQSASVSEVAFECGYANLSNFNRHFKRIVGCPPIEYKKNVQKLYNL